MTLFSINSFAQLALRLGRTDEAEPVLREGLARAEKALGVDHSTTINLLVNLGWALRTRGDLAGAEEHYRETMTRRTRALGEEHPLTIRVTWQVARLRIDQGDFDEATELARKAVEAGRRVLPPEDRNLAQSLLQLGLGLLGRGDHTEAEPFLRESVASLEKNPDSWALGAARSALGAALAGQGRCKEGKAAVLDGYRELVEVDNVPALRVRNAIGRTIATYTACGQPARAAEWREKLQAVDGRRGYRGR